MHFGFHFSAGQGERLNNAYGGGSGGGGGGGTQTVYQQQQIPVWAEDYAKQNMNYAQSLAAQPAPVYNAPIIADINNDQRQGFKTAQDQAFSYQPSLNMAQGFMSNASGINPVANDPTQNGYYGAGAVMGANPMHSASSGVNGLQQSIANMNMANNPGAVSAFMSPYVSAALQPQMIAAQHNLDQQQQQIGAQATGANAFGDARQGVANAYQNFLGNQTMAGIQAQGYNTAYANALQAANNEQSQYNQMVQGQLGLGNLGLNEQTQMLNQQNAAQGQEKILQNQQQMYGNLGAQEANLGQMAQQLGLSAANAQYNVGNIEQSNQQNQLTNAYQLYQNQYNHPYQMLNVMESALTNTPYSMQNAVTYPGQNQTQNALNNVAGITSLLGGLTGGGGSATGVKPITF